MKRKRNILQQIVKFQCSTRGRNWIQLQSITGPIQLLDLRAKHLAKAGCELCGGEAACGGKDAIGRAGPPSCRRPGRARRP